MKNIIININFPNKNSTLNKLFKNANQPPPNQPQPTTSQESPITPTTTNNPPPSTRVSFRDNPYTFEERHVRLSEPLDPVHCQAPLSEATYNLYPTLQQDLNRVRNISQNQNTLEIKRQIIHPRRKRNFPNPRIQFNKPESPTPTTSELSSSTIPETPIRIFGFNCNLKKIRENPFNPPDTTERPPYWSTHSYTQGEPNLVNEPIDISSDTTISSLPETLSLPSTPSLS